LNKPLPLLRVENLVKHFPVRQGLFGRANGAVRAVDGIDFELRAGETLALVGESRERWRSCRCS
jgi:ABC-type oligopeptide transport system ATPase subunit